MDYNEKVDVTIKINYFGFIFLFSQNYSSKELCRGISPSGSKNRGRKPRCGLGHQLIISEKAYWSEVSRRRPMSR